MEVAILLISFFLLLIIGVPIAYSIGLSAVLTLSVSMVADGLDVTIALAATAQRMATGLDSFTLLAIPFFILAGQLMNQGGVAKRLVDFAKALVGWLPGGLGLVNIIACILFGAISGSAVAAASAIGSFMHPRMTKEGYDPAFSAAINLSSATTGLVIPPSNVLIVYSLASGGVSIGALFLAGYIPGLLVGVMLMAVVMFISVKRGYPRAKANFRPLLQETIYTLPLLLITFVAARFFSVEGGGLLGISIVYALGLAVWKPDRVLPSLLLLVIVIGGIVGGIFTATEASAIAVLYTAILGFVYKELSFRTLPKVLLSSVNVTAIVLLLIAASIAFSWTLSFENLPQALSDALLSLSDRPIIILLLINLTLLIVGIFMDMTPAVLIFTPIFLPIVLALGIDPIHFGIIMVLNLCIGLCTPPVGSVLFVGAAVAKLPIRKVIPPLIPLFLAMLVALLLVTYFPSLSLWLPSVMGW
ncbi:MAG: TRAP transporter large permease [Bacteroidota bacterium]